MKPKKIELFEGDEGWYWHAIAGNGQIIADGSQGYARRNTAVRYMEQVTDAKKRGIPVFATNKVDKETRLY